MRIQVVINPASGQPEPVLSILNDTFAPVGIDWDVAITHGPGDGVTAARHAIDEGFDLIAAYGGDGTVSEVATALASGGPPMVLLPGGTGNALAEDLGVPRPLVQAAGLVASGEYDMRAVDMGRIGDGWFVLRATMGFEASVVTAATRELKDRFGWLAYAFTGLQALGAASVATYQIEIDGEHHEAEGLACIVANSASLGVLGVRMDAEVDVSDGQLDVIVVDNASLSLLAGGIADAVAGVEPRTVTRWAGKRIRVEAGQQQPVLSDGEPAGTTPVEVEVVPAAIRVVVPKPPPTPPAPVPSAAG